MGIDIRTMTLWQANATIAGHARANGSDVDEGFSDAEFDALSALLDRFQ